MRRLLTGGIGALLVALLSASPAAAFDAADEFSKGSFILSLQVGGGGQNNVEHHGRLSGISFFNFTPRLTYLPFEPFGPSFLRGAVEVGLEGWFQAYLSPAETKAGGLKLALRHDFVGLGRFVPYIEVLGGAGGTNLKTIEIRSPFVFVVEAGAGLAYFVTPGIAVNLGYRFQHVSNAGLFEKNRGFNADEGVLGVSFFFH